MLSQWEENVDTVMILEGWRARYGRMSSSFVFKITFVQDNVLFWG